MLKNKTVLAFALVIVTTLAATFSFYLWQVAKSPNLNVDGEKAFVLYIPKGATYDSVVDSLHEHKVIHDEIAFQFLTKWMEYREKVKPGRYEIPPNSGNREIIGKLRQGAEDPVRLTFNNVRLKEDLIEKIGTKMEFDSNELLKMLNDEKLCNEYGFSKENIMCMFLPDTYFVYWTISPKEFMDRMKYEYKKYWTEERLSKAEAIGMSPVEVGIMASIVQSETNKKDEQPKVAGLYINRIQQGIPLQADPTVKFALKDFGLKRILNVHLSTDSPYNTYMNLGLPPGPIALPEPNALTAVLNYDKHDYVYMCAKEDFSGYHAFAVDYATHLANARRYQQALNERNIR
jgi:UPF0755 protein